MIVAVIVSCDDANCTLYNSTYCECTFTTDLGQTVAPADTMTIWVKRHDGSDSILVNRSVRTTKLWLMLSYAKDVDTLFFDFRGKENEQSRDTVIISKTNIPHFESPDCGTVMFHDILNTEVRGSHFAEVRINHAEVYFNSQDNLRFILK